MPSYIYRCWVDTCGLEYECSHPIEERDTEHFCPVHLGLVMRRRLTTVATIFKGKGFYSTDKGK